MQTNEITADRDRLLQKIERLASLTAACIQCAHMIPDDESDRSGLLEQAVLNQQDIKEITQTLTGRE